MTISSDQPPVISLTTTALPTAVSPVPPGSVPVVTMAPVSVNEPTDASVTPQAPSPAAPTSPTAPIVAEAPAPLTDLQRFSNE